MSNESACMGLITHYCALIKTHSYALMACELTPKVSICQAPLW